MKLTNWLPRPLQRFVRERMTIYVYTYGFRPSAVVEEQALKFRISGRELTVKADYRTALYDMITEVVDYDAYQLQQIQWDSHREPHIIDIGANVGVTALVFSQIPTRVTAHVTTFQAQRRFQREATPALNAGASRPAPLRDPCPLPRFERRSQQNPLAAP